MCVEDRAHAAQRVSGDGRNLRFGAAADRKPRHRRSAQIVKGNTDDPSTLAGLTPRGAKAIWRPRFAVTGSEHDGGPLRNPIQRGLKRRADRNDYSTPAF